MQTFLPYPDYHKALNTLDPSRLGNQIYRECVTLFRGGWPNHPASKMWAGFKYSLGLYGLAGLKVLESRGKYYPKWFKYFEDELRDLDNTGNPPWLGYEPFHSSHRSNLLRKNKLWYSQFGWSEPDNLSYVWPSKLEIFNLTSERIMV